MRSMDVSFSPALVAVEGLLVAGSHGERVGGLHDDRGGRHAFASLLQSVAGRLGGAAAIVLATFVVDVVTIGKT